MKHPDKKAEVIYLSIIGADKLIGSLFATVQMVYFASNVTNDPFQLVLIWTVFQISVLLFEIPTGVVQPAFIGYSRFFSDGYREFYRGGILDLLSGISGNGDFGHRRFVP